jgi:hypothetical protein
MKEHFDGFIRSVNWRPTLIGVTTLLIGVLLYLVDRPPDQTYFVRHIGIDLSLHDTLPRLFGPFGNSLPAFIHVFSFILITAGLLACRKKGFIIVCLTWFFVDAAFELSQKYKSLAAIIPDRFAGIPFLENTENFIVHGTFDYVDMTCIFLGASLAYIVLLRTAKNGKGWSHEKKGN